MSVIGLIFIIIVLAIPAPDFWSAIGRESASAMFSQYLGVVALIAMAITQIMATRWRWIEGLFGPLDRVYVLHKWLGVLSMAAILLHDTIDAELRNEGADSWLMDLGETLGEVSLYALLILVVITVATFIPYHLWKWTHRFMGLMFAFGFVHYLTMDKPFDLTSPISLYVIVWCGLGILAWIWTLRPRSWARGYGYQLHAIDQHEDVQSLTFRPTGRPLRHSAGQFAFLRLDTRDGTAGETHPFTISNAPDPDGLIRFSIKEMGDDTWRLARQAGIGQNARIEGPFGRFGQGAGKKPEIWIAGGIGITPFLAMAAALPDQSAPVHLWLCNHQAATAAPWIQELDALAKPGLTLHNHASADLGRLTADHICHQITGQIGDYRIRFCGPRVMRETLREGFRRQGLSPRHFHYEEFEIRTGLGLKRFAAWLLDRKKQTHRSQS